MYVCVICIEESGWLCVCAENEHVFVKAHDRERERVCVCVFWCVHSVSDWCSRKELFILLRSAW